MGFPIVKTRAGNVAIIYTTQAGGQFSTHGAYLVRESDSNRWVPTSWDINGKVSNRPGLECDLDIVGEELTKLKNKNETPQAQEEVPIQE